MTAGLTDVAAFALGCAANGFAVGDLRLADGGFHLELTQKTIHDDFQMQLAHAGDDGLTGLLIGEGLEGGVFFRQLDQRHGHLILTGLGLGLDGHLNDRIGEDHALQHHLILFIAQGIGGGGVLQAHDAADVAGVNRFDFLTMVGVHHDQTAHALTLLLGRVEHVAAAGHRAAVNAGEGQLAHEGVGHDLEGQSGEGLVIGGMTVDLLFGIVGIHALDSRNIQRGGHVHHDGVQQGLYALVAVGSAAQHRGHGAADGRLADGGVDLILREFLALKELFEQRFIAFGNGLDHLLMILLGHFLQILGDLLIANILALVVVIDFRLHADEVDDALEIGFFANRQLDRHGVGAQPFLHHADNAEEVRAHDVHFVDVSHAGHIVLAGLTPNGFALGLYTALSAKHGNGSVQNAQAALYFDSKVHVAGGVDDVDPVSFPLAGGSSGSDGDTAFLLLLHPVHGGRTFMRLTQAVRTSRVEQDALGRGGFTGVDMSHNADIPHLFQGVTSRHR